MQEAQSLFIKLGTLTTTQYSEIAWKQVYDTLHALPKMFQLFAAKQVFNVSAVLSTLSTLKDYAHLGNKCPSCTLTRKTSKHVLHCREEGRVKNLNRQLH
jgi:hypothetical protein